MANTTLIVPLLIILAGALLAALSRLSGFNRWLTSTQMGWLFALIPLSAFGLLLSFLPAIGDGTALIWRIDWIPSLGLSLSLYLDTLSALFALLLTGIGTLIVIYTGYYFEEKTSIPDPSAVHGEGTGGGKGEWRFLAYLFMFMFAMLGLVMAGDLITLFIFWEMTSITSFLLIAYKYKDEAARRGAFKSLFITGGGGIALLAGVLMLGYVAGGSGWPTILNSGDLVRESFLYPVILGLVAFGAFTKSAQFPAHIWLPDAMSAPTPASAYLHSATMVKAGIYLMARLNPTLGFTDLWFWLLSLVGLTTMLAAAIIFTFNHSLIKAALLMLAGVLASRAPVKTAAFEVVTGLGKYMPATGVLFLVGGMALAGIPPTNGFINKMFLFRSGIQGEEFASLAAVGVASILTLVYVTRAFQRIWWQPPAEGSKAKPTGDRLLAPALLIGAVLVLGLWAAPLVELAQATAAWLGSPEGYVQAVLGGN